MTDTIDTNTEALRILFSQCDQVLNEYSGVGNLQFPILLGMMAVRFNWNEKMVREYDPLIRFHIRNHTEWCMARGAKGGIMRMDEKQKKDAAAQARLAAKAEVRRALDEKMAALPTDSTSNTKIA